jgi:hypothetical protein
MGKLEDHVTHIALGAALVLVNQACVVLDDGGWGSNIYPILERAGVCTSWWRSVCSGVIRHVGELGLCGPRIGIRYTVLSKAGGDNGTQAITSIARLAMSNLPAIVADATQPAQRMQRMVATLQ